MEPAETRVRFGIAPVRPRRGDDSVAHSATAPAKLDSRRKAKTAEERCRNALPVLPPPAQFSSEPGGLGASLLLGHITD